ncbi:hypothetical protein G4G28_19990 [Massilia sp. Dwa41.01b]|nr:hypothetical protein [Massilia sp. Dwa41.01b]QNA90209.1 hypothetical protein G4G28_19990 [Massilia sp. Dwa41.01b]
MLGGLGYMLAALFAPFDIMHLVGGGILAVAVAAAFLRCLGVGTNAARG